MRTRGLKQVLLRAIVFLALACIVVRVLAPDEMTRTTETWVLGIGALGGLVLLAIWVLPVEWPTWISPRPGLYAGLAMSTGYFLGILLDGARLISAWSSPHLSLAADALAVFGLILYFPTLMKRNPAQETTVRTH